MGGKIVRVNVQNEGQVASGEALLALTAMKMVQLYFCERILYKISVNIAN
jgi:acetyl/propionyl-CoA carboxylase alpha subunit